MGAMASQITSLTIVYSIVYSGGDHRKHQSSASLAFVRGIHRWPVNSPHKGPVTSNAENVSIWWRHHVSWAAFLGYNHVIRVIIIYTLESLPSLTWNEFNNKSNNVSDTDRLDTHIYFTSSISLFHKSCDDWLKPGDARMRRQAGSSLVQSMDFCLKHYTDSKFLFPTEYNNDTRTENTLEIQEMHITLKHCCILVVVTREAVRLIKLATK